jgi:hypothetical protein
MKSTPHGGRFWHFVLLVLLMQVTLPALTLEVVAPSRWRPWWVVGVGLVLAAGAAGCWRKRRTLRGAWEHRQAQRQASEAGCFAQVQKACRASDAVAAYNALLRWLDCTHHGPGSATWRMICWPIMLMQTSGTMWKPSRRLSYVELRPGTVSASRRCCTERAGNDSGERLLRPRCGCQH